jgi:hypothetical protein
MKLIAHGAACAALLACATPAFAHEPGSIRADSHAPIGVMADHTHEKGEWMVSYRFMRMEMDGSRDGTDSLSPEAITAIPNRFAPPAGLRVVPTRMTMDMHMIGAMYAPSERVTLMAMANYLENEMDHVTFQGMMGTTRLGEFTTRSSGFGDTRLAALIGLQETETARTHLTVGVSLPTGSIDETAQVLTPMNTTPVLTMPYAMQLGSGTADPMASITHVRSPSMHWRLGAQAGAVWRLYDNDADYRLGDDYQATAWASWSPVAAWAVSARAKARVWGEIEGRDPRIGAPIQTADPANYGGETLEAGFGVNWAGQAGVLRGHRFAAEALLPLHRDLNGPQMETDWSLTLGWQYAFGG